MCLDNGVKVLAAELPSLVEVVPPLETEISERFLIAAAERFGVRSQRGQWWLPG